MYAFSRCFHPKQLKIEENKHFDTEPTIIVLYDASFIVQDALVI